MCIRNGAYHSDFYAGGKRIRQRLSTDLDAATVILNDLRARADKADFGLLDNDYPLDKIREQYLRHCRQACKPSTVGGYEDALDNILPALGVTRAHQVTLEGILTYREDRLKEGASPRTVNIDVGALSAMLRWAAKPGQKLIASNPLAELKPLRHDSPKEGRALSDDEVKRLLDAAPPHWRDIWYAFLVTGMRKGEMAALTFRDIDWEARELVVRGKVAKNHRERRIPIDAGLWDILKKQEAGRKERHPGTGQTPAITEGVRARFSLEHVFVTEANTPLDHRSNIYHAFLRHCDKAGIQTRTLDADGKVIEHVDVHSLRRTFATNLIVSGADPESVRQLLGHRTLAMTMKIYTKVHAGTKRQALGKLSYGKGTLAPEHVVVYPADGRNPVQNGHRMVTDTQERKAN
jgi:integrase